MDCVHRYHHLISFLAAVWTVSIDGDDCECLGDNREYGGDDVKAIGYWTDGGHCGHRNRDWGSSFPVERIHK